MAQIEFALRLITIGQLGLLALVMALAWKQGRAVRYAALLALCVIAYLVMSSPALRPGDDLALWRAVLVLLAIAAPFSIWAFALSLFEEEKRLPLIPSLVIIAVILIEWITAMTRPEELYPWTVHVNTLHHVVALAAVGHAIYCAASGLRDDLAERRRRFRTVFVILTALQSFSILIAEFFLGYDDASQSLSLYNSIIISTLTLGFSLSFLGLRQGLFQPAVKTVVPQSAIPPSERALHDALMKHMNDGGYRETGLTITTLSAHLHVPEHRLRRLINRHLGFRNFSAFLNSYRLSEAREKLSDETQSHIPILTIAMDLGYGSIAPFNRAFKDSFGMTPKEYRQNPKNSADFEIDKAPSEIGQTE